MNITSQNQTDFLKFPCDFPIKVMGPNNENFELALLTIVRKHYPNLSEQSLTYRPSRNNKHVSITLTVHAENKGQLDAFYEELSDCKHILMAL